MNTDAMVVANQGLVGRVVNRYHLTGANREDAISEGTIGLILAAQKFDPARAAFSTYATWWITARVVLFLDKNMHGVVHAPKNARHQKFSYRIRRLSERLHAAGLETNAEIIAEQLGTTVKIVNACLDRDNLKEMRLDYAPEGRLAPIEYLQDGTEGVDDRLFREQRLDSIEEHIASLPERAQDIIRSRLASPPEPLAEIGLRYGLTRQRVLQIEEGAIKYIKRRMAFDGYKTPKKRPRKTPIIQKTLEMRAAARGPGHKYARREQMALGV